MSSQKRRAGARTFVDRHGLWSDAQTRAAAAVEKTIRQNNVELVRFSFADQHGTLRGKTLLAREAMHALRSGVTMTSTLLAKDTAHRNVFPVFEPGGGMGLAEMGDAGNFLMIADPETFRLLPWADDTGWLLCDCYFANGNPVPMSTRQLYRQALAKLSQAGFDYFAGLEIEFHLFKIDDHRLAPECIAWPPQPPMVTHTTHGYQYLTEGRYDRVAAVMDVLRKNITALGLPLRSIEVELGPSQFELTFAPEIGMAPADAMVLLRSALKQVAHRHGYLASLMCRPGLPNTVASGWHVHQSLLEKKSGANVFVAKDGMETLSPLGKKFLAGLLTNARAATAFAAPTLNGYKRYHGVNTMAPIQAVWAHDNRGVMARVMGGPGDPSTHLENRTGEPLANPYLYMASQIYAGLDGIARKLEPGPSADAPYARAAEPLPGTLAEALDTLRTNACFRAGFGDFFVDYYLHLKEAEIARYCGETVEKAWTLRYMLRGTARWMGLGSAHVLSLAEARDKADAQRKLLLDGKDPLDVREKERAAARLEAAKLTTFGQAATEYINKHHHTWKNAKHVAQWRQLTFGKRTAAINDLPVSEIEAAHVLKVLQPIWEKTPETGRRIRARIENVISFAVAAGYRSKEKENPARWEGHLKHMLAAPTKAQEKKRHRLGRGEHHKALLYAELPGFMATLRTNKFISARALEWTILNAARTAETIGATWTEIDMDAKVWTIPASRMKAGKEHKVPLSDRAIQILKPLPRDGKHVFPLSNMAMLQLVRGSLGNGHTVHGFRSTFRDWAGDRTRYDRETIEFALAHGITDKTEEAYRRGTSLEKRRRLMNEWSRFCSSTPVQKGSNVVTLAR